jgi:hypothetical protein
MAAFLLILLILLMVGSNEAIGYYYSHCQDDELMHCLFSGLDDEEEPQEGTVIATGTYELKGNAVTITANIPLSGGDVTGTVSGTCDGMIKGTFSGQPNGAISGTMKGACAPFFINIPSSADFNGTVNKTAKTVPFSFTGRGGGLTHEDSMSLSYP